MSITTIGERTCAKCGGDTFRVYPSRPKNLRCVECDNQYRAAYWATRKQGKFKCEKCGTPISYQVTKLCRDCVHLGNKYKWKGGRSLTSTGYISLYGRRRKLEHREVMEVALGRSLLKDEQVHHVNGVKTDNRIENLELWVKSQPAGQRVPELVSWAEELLLRYAPSKLRRSKRYQTPLPA